METEVIIMIASFLCGVIGMAFAKKAKEKNNMALLVLSGIFALLTFGGLITAVIFTFFVK